MTYPPTSAPTCPECSTPLVVVVVKRVYEGDVVHLRRRADCPQCPWHGFDWRAVPRSAAGG
jgi:hypothetical protein